MTYDAETRILRADEGKWVTEDFVNPAIEVKLAPSESVDNWHEVSEWPPIPPENNDNNETENENGRDSAHN